MIFTLLKKIREPL